MHWAADAAAVVGHEANRVRLVKPAETVYSVKRFMGRRGAGHRAGGNARHLSRQG
ncbi:MAG: hypothetical protein WDN00_07590 [Limisphaerales bacterium]